MCPYIYTTLNIVLKLTFKSIPFSAASDLARGLAKMRPPVLGIDEGCGGAAATGAAG